MDQISNDWLLNGFALFWVIVVLYGLRTGKFKQPNSSQRKERR